MALLTNLLLLSASLICVVESAPTTTEAQPTDTDAIRHRANFCTPFLRRTDGSPMKEDMATYYAKKNCSMNNIFLTLLDTRRGHDMLNEVIVQGKKDASICEGFIAILSLIDAYNLTEDMCANRVLVSESRSFCDNWPPTDSEAVIKMLTQYELVKVAADVLSKLDGKEGCLEVCGGVIDSAICSGFMDATKFFSDRVSQDQPGTNRAREPTWITKGQKGGRGNESPAPGTDSTTMKVESNSSPEGTTSKVESNSGPDSTTRKVESNSNNDSVTGNKVSTKEEGVDSAAPTGVGVNDEHPTVSTTSWLSSFAQQNNVTQEELQLIMKKLQEERNQSRLSSQPTTQVPTDDDAVDRDKEKSLPTERPSSAALGELTPAPSSDTETVAPKTPMIGEEGATAKGEALQPDSYPLVNDGDTTPSNAVGDGDDRGDQYRKTPGRDDDDFYDTTFDGENDQNGLLGPGLGENQHENTKSKPTAEQQHPHVPDEHPPPVGDEHPPPVADKHPPPIKPSQINSNNESENEQKSYGAWHFFTIFLVIAGSAVVCYVCVHNRKKIREGVSSYTSDKKRRRRVRDYQPLSTTGKM